MWVKQFTSQVRGRKLYWAALYWNPPMFTSSAMTLAVCLQEVLPRTQPGPGVKKCQDPSLCQCCTTFENPPLRALPASWVNNGSRRPNDCLWKWPSFFSEALYLFYLFINIWGIPQQGIGLLWSRGSPVLLSSLLTPSTSSGLFG